MLFVSLTTMTHAPAVRTLIGEADRAVGLLQIPLFGNARQVGPTPGLEGPHYPEGERDARHQGEVNAEFVVDENGVMVPGTLRILSYASEAFARAVFEFLGRARFTPATIGGCPVKELVMQPFQFWLSTGPRPPIP